VVGECELAIRPAGMFDAKTVITCARRSRDRSGTTPLEWKTTSTVLQKRTMSAIVQDPAQPDPALPDPALPGGDVVRATLAAGVALTDDPRRIMERGGGAR